MENWSIKMSSKFDSGLFEGTAGHPQLNMMDNLLNSSFPHNSLPKGASQLAHIFGEREGHLPDTPRNRQRIEKLANDESKLLGIDHHGSHWFASTLPDGSQLWAQTYNGTIQECGLNKRPRLFDSTTGLRNNPFKGA